MLSYHSRQRLRPRNWFVRRRRKQHAELGAFPGGAVHLNAASIASNEAMHGCQTQSPPHEFGGEERIENPALSLLVHAAARILHFQGGIFAWSHRRLKFALPD